VISYILNTFRSMLTVPGLLMIPAVLLTIPLHELAHGWAAYLLGDTTARDRGRLSLNPMAHFDLIGFICMVFFRFGWAKPVPIDSRYFNVKNRKLGICFVSLAGPIMNLILAGFSAVVFHIIMQFVVDLGVVYYVAIFFYELAVLNVSLAVFNLIPISPLDGSKILYALLPDRIYYRILQYEQYGMFVLTALILSGALDGVLDFLRNPMLKLFGLI